MINVRIIKKSVEILET